MKILFVASDNYHASGAFLCMVKLILCLKEWGIDSLVILPKNGSGTELLKNNLIKYRIVKSYNWGIQIDKKRNVLCKMIIAIKKLINYFATYRISQIAHIEKCNLIHINTTYSYVGAMAAQKISIPVVWHLREYMEEDQNMTFWNKEISYQLINNSKSIIAISANLAEKYNQIFDKEKLKVIYDGIDTKFCNPQKKILTQDNLKIAIIGRVSEKKGQNVVLQAVAKVLSMTTIEIIVRIVGGCSQEYMKEIQMQIANLGLKGVVELLGEKENVIPYYEWADILVMASVSEAFGRVTVEGMMSGCLIIGSNTGGTQELVRHGITGYQFEQGNSVDLADKILAAVQNKEMSRKIADTGRKDAMVRFTAENNAKEIVRIYEAILNEK